MTVKEASRLWNITDSIITRYCRDGKIEGAIKDGKSWLIPDGTPKPADARIKSGRYIREIGKYKTLLPLPIGVSDYKKASTEYYYVDKTMMIKDFIDEKVLVSLFTRPRRFGKTLNMDMLKTFFEISDEDTSVYFRDKKIWAAGERYRKYQGRYPVIFVSFKDVKYDTWEDTLDNIKDVFKDEYSRHRGIIQSDMPAETDKIYFQKILTKDISYPELTAAFKVLSRMLDDYYGIAPVIIIDEYDTPIQQGHSRGYYNQVIDFMRNLFSGGLKDNPHLSYGFLTGILRVAKESIFSGLNNLKINSIIDDRYSEYFGFTEAEVKAMARYYNRGDKIAELREWYDGYRFGDTDIYNPWSVINYFNNYCKPLTFWQATGSNEAIGEILSLADEEMYGNLSKILQGEHVLTNLDTGVIYPEIRTNPASVYSFLLVAGYLKIVRCEYFNGTYMCETAIPNKEISYVYRKEILGRLTHIIPQSKSNSVQEALYTKNPQALREQLRRLLLESASSYDTVRELYFQGLLIGLTAMMDDYIVTSNTESGDGRYDIQLEPRRINDPGIIIELKHEKNMGDEQLAGLAKTALEQINKNNYTMSMTAKGINNIIKYGVAFSGKHVEVAVE